MLRIHRSIQHRKKNCCHNRAFVLDGTTGNKINTTYITVCAKLLQLYMTLWDPMACNLSGSSVGGILQARVMEWVAPAFSLRVPRTARRSNQSILKEINPEYSLEELTLKLNINIWPPDAKSQLIKKYPDARKD